MLIHHCVQICTFSQGNLKKFMDCFLLYPYSQPHIQNMLLKELLRLPFRSINYSHQIALQSINYEYQCLRINGSVCMYYMVLISGRVTKPQHFLIVPNSAITDLFSFQYLSSWMFIILHNSQFFFKCLKKMKALISAIFWQPQDIEIRCISLQPHLFLFAIFVYQNWIIKQNQANLQKINNPLFPKRLVFLQKISILKYDHLSIFPQTFTQKLIRKTKNISVHRQLVINKDQETDFPFKQYLYLYFTYPILKFSNLLLLIYKSKIFSMILSLLWQSNSIPSQCCLGFFLLLFARHVLPYLDTEDGQDQGDNPSGSGGDIGQTHLATDSADNFIGSKFCPKKWWWEWWSNWVSIYKSVPCPNGCSSRLQQCRIWFGNNYKGYKCDEPPYQCRWKNPQDDPTRRMLQVEKLSDQSIDFRRYRCQHRILCCCPWLQAAQSPPISD